MTSQSSVFGANIKLGQTTTSTTIRTRLSEGKIKASSRLLDAAPEERPRKSRRVTKQTLKRPDPKMINLYERMRAAPKVISPPVNSAFVAQPEKLVAESGSKENPPPVSSPPVNPPVNPLPVNPPVNPLPVNPPVNPLPVHPLPANAEKPQVVEGRSDKEERDALIQSRPRFPAHMSYRSLKERKEHGRNIAKLYREELKAAGLTVWRDAKYKLLDMNEWLPIIKSIYPSFDPRDRYIYNGFEHVLGIIYSRLNDYNKTKCLKSCKNVLSDICEDTPEDINRIHDPAFQMRVMEEAGTIALNSPPTPSDFEFMRSTVWPIIFIEVEASSIFPHDSSAVESETAEEKRGEKDGKRAEAEVETEVETEVDGE